MADMNIDQPIPADIDELMTAEQHATLSHLVEGIFAPNGMGHWRTFDTDSRRLTVGSGIGRGIVINAYGWVISPDRMTDSVINVDNFLRGYIECALWSSGDGGDGHLDDDSYTLSDEARKRMREDCEDFCKHHADDLREYCERRAYDPSQGEPEDYAGHDFWLTRNGHGAGFWDRGLGELGDRLADAAKAYGSVDLYLGDDGTIYQN